MMLAAIASADLRRVHDGRRAGRRVDKGAAHTMVVLPPPFASYGGVRANARVMAPAAGTTQILPVRRLLF